MEPQNPSEGFMINFIPDASYIKSNLESLDSYRARNGINLSSDHKLNMNFIYHSTNDIKIFQDDDYLHFMTKFGPKATHIIDCRQLNPDIISRVKAVELAYKYQQICPRLFPLIKLNTKDKLGHLDALEELTNIFGENINFIIPTIGMEYALSPKEVGPKYNEEINHLSLYNDINYGQLNQLSQLVKNKLILESKYFDNDKFDEIIPEKVFSNEPELTFYGTISMKPGINK